MDPSNISTTCTASSTITTTNTGCKKFYIYDSTGGKYKMIMDRNTTATVAWNSSNSNSTMNEVATALATDTANWIGGPRLITADEVAHIVGADLNTTIKWSSSKTYVESPTNIDTQSSWVYLDGGRNSAPTTYSTSNGWQKQYATTTGASKYAWLYDNTYQCTDFGCNNSNSSSALGGYWTSTPVTGSIYYVWRVTRQGKMDCKNSHASAIGLRPVIEVPKSIID